MTFSRKRGHGSVNARRRLFWCTLYYRQGNRKSSFMGSGGKAGAGSPAGNFALLIVSSLLALVLAEFLFRAFVQFEWRRAARYHEHALYRMLPDNPREYALHPGVSRLNRIPDSGQEWTYRINSEGFRGDEFDLASERRRILFIGDSYTFGWGVEQSETLPRAVEKVLAGPPYNLAVDAWNLGVPGYNTVLEYHLLEQVIDRYAPDLVVLGYVMNDAQPQYNVHERPAVRYRYVTSWLLAFVKDQANRHLFDGRPVLHTGLNIPDGDFLAAVRENQPKWAAGRQAFTDMVALARSRDVPFVLVIFPSYNKVLRGRYPFRPIHRKLAGWAAEEGVGRVDLLDHLLDGDNASYRIEGDGHPSPRAFAEAAVALAPTLAGLLSPENAAGADTGEGDEKR